MIDPMTKGALFYEKQRFTQWWIWLILLPLNAVFIFGIYRQVIGGVPFGDKPMSDTGLLMASGLMLLLTIAMANIKLETYVRNEGLYVRFFPFHLKFRHFAWSHLVKIYVRTYSPVTEYGGWGLRLGIFGSGFAYNIRGDKGLQLQFPSGKKILIGTQKPDELSRILDEIGQIKQ